MSEEGSSGWKFLSIVLIVILASVSFVCLYSFSSPVAAEPSFIEVSINGKAKLGVNETGVYQAMVESETSGNLEYVWSVSPNDNMTVLSFDGASAWLTFVSATEEPYLLSVRVHDVTHGNYGNGALTVYDPYTTSSLYLNSALSSYNYIFESETSGNLEYVWSVSPNDNMTVLSFDGASAWLTFVSATEEPYLLSVRVHDVTHGNYGNGALTV